MGIKQLPDTAQQIMEDLFRSFDDVEVYIDDIGIFSSSWWEEHVVSLSSKRFFRLFKPKYSKKY
jgi:hypothetical protein